VKEDKLREESKEKPKADAAKGSKGAKGIEKPGADMVGAGKSAGGKTPAKAGEKAASPEELEKSAREYVKWAIPMIRIPSTSSPRRKRISIYP
jgi:hypothetical protein